MKKLCLLLVLCLLLGFGGALAESNVNLDSTFPIVKEPVAVTIGILPGSPQFNVEKNQIITYFEKHSNLDITWVIVPDGERMNMLLASDDLPDAMIGYGFTSADIVQYGVDGGMLRPWNDLLEYTPAFNKITEDHPEYLSALTASDGNIYGLPMLSDGFGCSGTMHFAWNVDWLENVGMDMPTTLDEFYDALVAFRDMDANGNGDPSDEIPWVGSWVEGGGERSVILSAYGYVGEGDLAIDYKGGKDLAEAEIIYIPLAEHYKDYLTFMNKLWNEGLLDPDIFTQTELQAQTKATEGRAGFSFMSTPASYYPQDIYAYRHMKPMVDDEANAPILYKMNPVSAINYVISSKVTDEQAQALANFGDCFFTCEVTWMMLYGVDLGSEDDYYGWGAFVKDGDICYNYEPDATDYWSHCNAYLSFWCCPGYRNQGAVAQTLEYAEKYPDSVCAQLFGNGFKYSDYEESMIEAQAEHQVVGVPAFYMTSEDLERVTALETDIENYVTSMEAKFITGDLSIEDDFEEFLSTLEEYGIEEYIDRKSVV